MATFVVSVKSGGEAARLKAVQETFTTPYLWGHTSLFEKQHNPGRRPQL